MSDVNTHITFDRNLREDLQRRLGQTRWSDAASQDWRYGMNEGVLRALVRHWHGTYDSTPPRRA